MLRKEVKEVIKQSLVFIVIAAVMPIPVLLGSHLFGSALSYGEVFFFVFHVGLLIFSVFMGTSLFSRDMGDGGMEYLLTLPYSRLQLLAIKLVPRFLAVVTAFVLYVILLLITGMSPDTSNTMPLLSTGSVFFLCICLFIIGVPFSITRSSIVISALATLFALMVYLGIIHLFFPTALLLKGLEIYYIHSLFQSLWNMPGYIWFSAVTLLLGSLMAFIYAFKRFNLGPSRGIIKRYLKVFIPVFVIVVVVSTVWAAMQLRTPKKSYYLTNSHQLVETDYFSARIYDKTGAKEISEGDFYWWYSYLEKGNYLYATYNSRYDSKFVRLDLRDPNYSVEVIYTAKGNASIREPHTFNNVFAFFERRYRDSRSIYFLVVVQPETGEFKKIEVPSMPGFP
jgi:ABC-type transport system involved in multi-copper enzyme maturation permease subunit